MSVALNISTLLYAVSLIHMLQKISNKLLLHTFISVCDDRWWTVFWMERAVLELLLCDRQVIMLRRMNHVASAFLTVSHWLQSMPLTCMDWNGKLQIKILMCKQSLDNGKKLV